MYAALGRNVFWIYGALQIKIIIIVMLLNDEFSLRTLYHSETGHWYFTFTWVLALKHASGVWKVETSAKPWRKAASLRQWQSDVGCGWLNEQDVSGATIYVVQQFMSRSSKLISIHFHDTVTKLIVFTHRSDEDLL